MIDPLPEIITKEFFLQSGVENVIADCQDKECNSYSSQFSAKAIEAEQSGDVNTQEVFRLLSSITSMYLKLDSPSEPFGAMMELHDRRTSIPTDFDNSRLDLLHEVVSEISDAELRARIADVLWLRRRDYKMGELAITSYLESAGRLEDPENWVATAERIERALQIAANLGRSGKMFDAVISYVNDLLDKYDGEDPLYLSAKMMELLLERKAGDTDKQAARAEKLALRAESARDWDRARRYWELKASWNLRGKDEVEARKAKIAAAETHVKKAEMQLEGTPPVYMLVASHIQFAIEAYRRIGNTQGRVDELHQMLLRYQRQATPQMVTYSSSVEVGELVETAINHVKGKPLQDALIHLTGLGGSSKVEQLKAQAEEHKKRYVLQSLFPRVYLNAAGKVVARQPNDPEESLQADMFSNASRARLIQVQALIEPARWQINSEHHVRIEDFLPFIQGNPFIPQGHEYIVARGLHSGMQGDFLTAVHFLVPQIEASVRYILSQVGVIASGLTSDGIQDEYSLNRTLREPEFSEPLCKVFGEDFVFDLRGLLIERFGANLRNDMAHGLIEHNIFYSESGCYLWWLSLRFYSLPIVASFRREQSSTADEMK